jgi:hypothetical protein
MSIGLVALPDKLLLESSQNILKFRSLPKLLQTKDSLGLVQ